jgi:hypothetical protein
MDVFQEHSSWLSVTKISKEVDDNQPSPKRVDNPEEEPAS